MMRRGTVCTVLGALVVHGLVLSNITLVGLLDVRWLWLAVAEVVSEACILRYRLGRNGLWLESLELNMVVETVSYGLSGVMGVLEFTCSAALMLRRVSNGQGTLVGPV